MATRVRVAAGAVARFEGGEAATVISLWPKGKISYRPDGIISQGSRVCWLASLRNRARLHARESRRQAAILDAVQHQPVRNQEQLRRRLRTAGFDVTQATLSRDIRELQLVKGGPDGAYQAPRSRPPTGTVPTNIAPSPCSSEPCQNT